jgi:predicted dienelactone hydrolase
MRRKHRLARAAVPAAAGLTAVSLAALSLGTVPLATAASAAAATSHRAGAAADTTAASTVSLPRPTGPYQVGTVALHLIDASRANPWQATPPYRELMVSVFYPARDTAGHFRAPELPAGTAAAFDGLNAGELGVSSGKVDWAATRTWAYRGAQVDRQAAPRGGFPVVLFSPGAGDPRGWDTTLAENLAADGFVVVSLDATYDASGVEFPGNRVVTTVLPQVLKQAQQNNTVGDVLKKVVAVRADDVSFTLDELARIQAGQDPDAEHRPLPAGLAGSLDLARVGMAGQSAGGSTAAQAMYQDPRVKAGIDMDGILEYAGDPTPGAPFMSSATYGLRRPFLLLGSQSSDGESLSSDPSWRSLYDRNGAWVRDITMAGSRHVSYTDAESVLPQVASEAGISKSTLTDDIGTIAPAREVRIEEIYVSAFFDRFLRGGHDPLLDGPSPAFPEMEFQH